MEISNEWAETLRKLSKVNLDFLEFVDKNPETLKRSNYLALKSCRDANLQAWPTFINPQTKALLREMGINVCNLIKSIPARLFNNDPQKMAVYYEQPGSLIKLQMEGVGEEHLANMVGRGDFTFSLQGLKCMEFNISASTIGGKLPEWESFYLNTPVLNTFLKERRIKIKNDNYLEMYLDHVIRFTSPLAVLPQGNARPELNVAMAATDYNANDQGQKKLQEDLQQVYQNKLSARSFTGNIFLCDFSLLEYNDDKVYLKGKRIHGLVELFHGVVPPGVIKAFVTGNLRLLNGPITAIVSNKLNLALLSENQESSLFNSEEKETIRNCIPWSRKIIPGETFYQGEKINMEPFLIANKDKLVIKPPLGFGGQSVCIGQSTFRREWEHLVQVALRKKSFLVQELLEPARGLYQTGENGFAYHDIVWGVWILGSQYGASFIRVVPRGNTRKVVNVTQGAELGMVFEVDE